MPRSPTLLALQAVTACEAGVGHAWRRAHEAWDVLLRLEGVASPVEQACAAQGAWWADVELEGSRQGLARARRRELEACVAASRRKERST
jgi:hypothetical protein